MKFHAGQAIRIINKTFGHKLSQTSFHSGDTATIQSCDKELNVCIIRDDEGRYWGFRESDLAEIEKAVNDG